MKLRSLKPTVRKLERTIKPVPTPSEKRITGTTLKNRRFKMWSNDPHCQSCGKLVDWPWGFELDHVVPLQDGGPDIEANCQVLCMWIDLQGVKQGCHAVKTAEERHGGRVSPGNKSSSINRALPHA